MFRCSQCTKKIGDNEPLNGLNVKFKERIDFSDKEGQIIQVELLSRNTSVPMIVTSGDSDAKAAGVDGIFVTCSEKCGEKMRRTLEKEKNMFGQL